MPGGRLLRDSAGRLLRDAASGLLLREVAYTLTVESTPGGAQVAVSPPDLDGQGGGTAPFVRSYQSGTHVTLAVPQIWDGKYFASWAPLGYEANEVTLWSTPDRRYWWTDGLNTFEVVDWSGLDAVTITAEYLDL